MDMLNILVVDDEPGMRSGAFRALRDFQVSVPDIDGQVGFHVETAATGEEAIEKIASSQPHILLLDFKLPGINGLEVLEKVRPDGLGPLTIMMTAYASIETAVRATKRGAYDFLSKPFTPAELKNAVQKAAQQIIVAHQARKLAEEKRQVRFQFISVLAHELKAPLAAVEGYLRIMRDRTAGSDPAVYDEMVQRCLVRAEYMRKMIFDLLDLTRIESGQRKRSAAEADLCGAARDAIETALPDATQRGIAIELHPAAPVMFKVDRSELDIILNNLVSNAVKYNRDNGRVEVVIGRLPDGGVDIKVSDTGIGLTEQETKRLFNDFVRIKNEQTKNILGSGLGLSTVRKLALLYGGDTSVESKPGIGSTFTVTLRRFPKEDEMASVASANEA